MISNLLSSNFFSKSALHLYVILACILMQMLNWGEPYRLLADLNVLIVSLVTIKQYRQFTCAEIKHLGQLSIVLLGFIALHLIATQHLEFTREMRRILLAIFLMIGIWLQVRNNEAFIKQYIFKLSLWILVIYVLAQAVAIWLIGRPYGTTNNPHYLAFYSAVGLMFGLYAFFSIKQSLRWLLAIPVLLLGILLVKTGSRPTWIGLIIASLLIVFYLEHKKRKWAFITLITVLATLSVTNFGGFESRFADLLLNLKTEERVTIWQDVWRMQNDSNTTQWILGHGLDVFKDDFMAYSHYHLKNVDFNSPHNFILELLYTTGFIGAGLATMLVVLMYRYLSLALRANTPDKAIYLLLMAVFTTMLITVSITVPYFSGYNLNTMAVIFGILLSTYSPYLKKPT